jgi:hypothetical protein
MTVPRFPVPAARRDRRDHHQAPIADPITLASIPQVRLVTVPSRSVMERKTSTNEYYSLTSMPIICIRRIAFRDVAIPGRSR